MNKKLKLPQICCLYYFLIRAGFLGVSSNCILHLSRQDGWLSIVVGCLMGLVPLLLFLYLQNAYPNESILGISKRVFGEWIGKIINLVLCFFIFFIVCIIFYDMINFISSQYLNQTPMWAIAIMFFIPLVYILSKGIPVIARTFVILFYFAMILFFLSVVGLIKESSMDQVKPFWEYGLFPILQGGLSYVAINVLPLLLLLIIPRNQIDIKKHYTLKIIFIYIWASITLLITLYLILSIFGIDLSLLYQYPEFHVLKLITLGFVSRLEGILAIQWLFDLFAFLVMGVYFLSTYFKEDWHLSKSQKNPFMVVICMILVFVVEHLFSNNTSANAMILKYSTYVNFGILLGIPFVIWIGFLYKKKRN